VVAKKDGAIVDITWPPSHPRAVYSSLSVSGEILENLRPYLERGELKAVIDPKGKYDFENVIEAFGYIETGRAWGKVVVSCFPNHNQSSILSEIDTNIQHVNGNLEKDLDCLNK
jgi:2-methylene-furan-3-one reductase